jgi:hypothetical protein
MAITIAIVIRNMCLSRHWKFGLEYSKICIQTLVSLAHLVAQIPDQTRVVQSVHNLSRTESELQSTVATKPYVKTGHMSNQQKSECVGDIFHI